MQYCVVEDIWGYAVAEASDDRLLTPVTREDSIAFFLRKEDAVEYAKWKMCLESPSYQREKE